MRSGGTLALLVLLLNPGAISAEALRFETDAGTVRALRGGTLVWENRHDRGGQLGDAAASGGLVGPIQVGDLVHYSIGASAFRVDAATGAVRARVLLPGFCTALRQDGDAVRLSVASASGAGAWRKSYRVGPDGHDVPFFLPAGFIAARLSRNDAENVLTGLLEADPEAPQRQPGNDAWRRRPELRTYLEAAVAELAALAERDPTNPWYHYWRGEYFEDLERPEDATAAFRSVLELDPAYDFELLPMVLRLDVVSPELGDVAFGRALRFLIAHGFEPESMFALTSVAIHYGFAGKRASLDPATDLDRLVRLGQRLWDLRPVERGSRVHVRGPGGGARRRGPRVRRGDLENTIGRGHALASLQCAQPARILGRSSGERGHRLDPGDLPRRAREDSSLRVGAAASFRDGALESALLVDAGRDRRSARRLRPRAHVLGRRLPFAGFDRTRRGVSAECRQRLPGAPGERRAPVAVPGHPGRRLRLRPGSAGVG